MLTLVMANGLKLTLAGVAIGLTGAFVLNRALSKWLEHLNEEGRGSTIGSRGRRFRSSLVVSEVALAIVLLIGADLMLQSFQRLRTTTIEYGRT